MKKLFLLIVALFVMTTAKSQVEFNFGPKIGYQSSFITRAEYDDGAIANGSVTFGAFGRLTFNKFIIQPEFMYSAYSFELQRPTDIDARNHSLAFPVMFGYELYDADFIKLRGSVGPIMYIGLKDVFKKDGELLDLNDNNVYSTLAKWTHSKVSLGAVINIGVDISCLTLDFNYSHGLTNVFYQGVVPASRDTESYKQNVFTITLGYVF